MNPQNPELVLVQFYRKQATEYEQILDLIVKVVESMQADDVNDATMSEVYQRIQSLHERDQSIAATRNSWIATGRRPGTELAQVLKQVEGLILKLLESVSEAERIADAAKSKLLPTLSQKAIARKMHSAYVATSTSGVQ